MLAAARAQRARPPTAKASPSRLASRWSRAPRPWEPARRSWHGIRPHSLPPRAVVLVGSLTLTRSPGPASRRCAWRDSPHRSIGTPSGAGPAGPAVRLDTWAVLTRQAIVALSWCALPLVRARQRESRPGVLADRNTSTRAPSVLAGGPCSGHEPRAAPGSGRRPASASPRTPVIRWAPRSNVTSA